MVIAGGFLIGILSLFAKSTEVSGCIFMTFLVAAFLKQLVWGIASIALFDRTIQEQCDGSIYAYGLALAIIHAIYLVCFGVGYYTRNY